VKTYGTITWFKGAWIIAAEPHVVIRLRRVFPRVARKDDFIGIADTVEVSREIEWFMSRFPLAYKEGPPDEKKPGLSPAQVEARLAERARLHRDGESLVDSLIKGVRKSFDFRLAVPAREYQKLGGTLFLSTPGILIADDLGTGKTCTAICGITEARARPALVVTLTHLPGQWESEIRKFSPRLVTHVIEGTRPYDIRKRCGGQFPDVVIMSYSKLDGWGTTLAPVIKSVIYDEVQELRNGTDTNKGKGAAAISRKATYRAGLSATPVYNMGGELHSVMEMIRPGALGTKTEFRLEHCVGDSEKPGKLKLKDPKAMGTYLRDAGLMIRRTRKDIGREIPKLTRVPHEIDSDQETLKKIEGKAIELAKIIMSKTAAARGETFQASQELNNLVRQATGVAKAPYVAEFVRMLVASDERVVVYAWHREVYAILMEQLCDARKDGGDLRPVMYTGSESPKQKQASKDEFCGGDSRVMLMSLRSGAGLDGLQNHCRIGAFAELDWSPGVHEQDEGRIARDGQPDPTLFYYLLSTSGSDPIIADMLGIKRGQIEGIRDPNGAFEHGLDADGQNVRKLAQAILLKHTKSLPSGARVVR
jgi:SNF2 family DNA or RNA helicase